MQWRLAIDIMSYWLPFPYSLPTHSDTNQYCRRLRHNLRLEFNCCTPQQSYDILNKDIFNVGMRNIIHVMLENMCFCFYLNLCYLTFQTPDVLTSN